MTEREIMNKRINESRLKAEKKRTKISRSLDEIFESIHKIVNQKTKQEDAQKTK